MKKPTLEELELQCVKAGLPKDQAQHFMDYYESNGWKVGRNPMASWPHALANWKRNFDARRYAASVVPIAGPQKPVPSVFNLKTIIEAKETDAKYLKDVYCVEGPLTNDWTDREKQARFAELRREIKELRTQLAGLL